MVSVSVWTLGIFLLQGVLAMQSSLSGEGDFVMLARPTRLTDSFMLLCRSMQEINALVSTIDFMRLNEVDLLLLVKPETYSEASEAGMMLSVSIPRENILDTLVNRANLINDLNETSTFKGALAGLKLSCAQPDTACSFSLLFRKKRMSKKVAEGISKGFPKECAKTSKPRDFTDTFSSNVWNTELALKDCEACSWRLSLGETFLSFDEQTVVVLMELVESEALPTFKFTKGLPAFDNESSAQYEVPKALKHILPRILLNLNLRSEGVFGSSTAGFENLISFSFEVHSSDSAVMTLNYHGQICPDVEKLKLFVELGKFVNDHTTCFSTSDESIWALNRGGFLIPLKSINEPSEYSKEQRMFLTKTKTVAGGSKLQAKSLGTPNYVIGFEIPSIETNLPAIISMIHQDLLSETTLSCSFASHLCKIGIDKSNATGKVQFAFAKSTDVEDLKDAAVYLTILCHTVASSTVGPIIKKSAETGKGYTNFDLVLENNRNAPPIAPVVQEMIKTDSLAVSIEAVTLEKAVQKEIPETQPEMENTSQNPDSIKLVESIVVPPPKAIKEVKRSEERQAQSIGKSPLKNSEVLSKSVKIMAEQPVQNNSAVTSAGVISTPPVKEAEQPKKIEKVTAVKQSEVVLAIEPLVNIPSKKNKRRTPLFTMSQIEDVDKRMNPKEMKERLAAKDSSSLITKYEMKAGESLVETVAMPCECKLFPLNLDEWRGQHPDAIVNFKTPSSSPFGQLDEPLEFWIHKGPIGESVQAGRFVRVFPSFQKIRHIEGLYLNLGNCVIDVFAEQKGQNHLGLFKGTPKTTSIRTCASYVLPDQDEGLFLLNRIWQFTIMLFIDSEASWYQYVQGITIDPASTGKMLRIQIWWVPEVSGIVKSEFEEAFQSELSRIASMPMDSRHWELLA